MGQKEGEEGQGEGKRIRRRMKPRNKIKHYREIKKEIETQTKGRQTNKDREIKRKY